MKQETKLWILVISSFACLTSIVLIAKAWMLNFDNYYTMCIALTFGIVIGINIAFVSRLSGKLISWYYDCIRNRTKNENTT